MRNHSTVLSLARPDDLAFSALPGAPVVDHAPTLRHRVADRLHRVADRLAPTSVPATTMRPSRAL